jgi:dephospho-CoA kinase
LLKVGLTGGIASGKSTVGAMFVNLGAHLIQADEIAHQLMRPGEPVYEEVVRHFGAQILNEDKTIHRKRLAEAAFGEARVQELNRIVHPAVIEKQEAWMEEVGRREPNAIAMVEAALIIEARAARRFDRLIVVTADVEQRVQRWAAKVKTDLESAGAEITRRMAAQIPDEEKTRQADYVIDNSGSLDETERQVRVIYDQLRAVRLSREKS